MATDAELSTFVAMIDSAAAVVDLDGRLVASNAAFRRLFGNDPDALAARVTDANGFADRLAEWSRMSSALPGRLDLNTPEGPQTYRVDGARVAQTKRIVVRLRERSTTVSAFTELTARINELNREVERRRRADALFTGQVRLLELIARGEPLHVTLNAIARFVEDESRSGSNASVLLVEDGLLRHGAAPSLAHAYVEAIDGTAIGEGVGSCGTAAYRNEPINVTDIATDPLWADFKGLALEYGLRACWSTPVRGSDGSVVATIANYYREPRPVTHDDDRLTEMARFLVGIAIDQSRREDALHNRAAQLAEADARKNEFLAMLGHELRNPLSPITTAVELLSGDLGTDAQRKKWMGVIDRQVSVLGRLVDDLLDIARVTRGKILLRARPIDLRQIIGGATAEGERDGRVHVHLPDEPIVAEVDQERLLQVVANLLHNARKFTSKTGRIDVTLDTVGTEARLTIADDGEGIDPDELPRIFDLFAQTSRTLDREKGGLGIGLTLVRSIVGLHGGTVEARSPGRTQGTTFEIRLPMCASADEPEAANDSLVRGDRLRVVVVDDNESAAELLAGLLERWGHTTRVATDGETALAIDEPADVYILDIGLPRIDGYEVARRLRARGVSARLIALSGYGQDADKTRAFEVGFDRYLVKPVNAAALRAELRLVPRVS